MLGDVDSAVPEQTVDFPRLGNGRATFADMLTDTAFEIADRPRVFAVLQRVPVALRRAATGFGRSRDKG